MKDLREQIAAITCEGCREGWTLFHGRDLQTGNPNMWHGKTGLINTRPCTSKADEILALLGKE